MNTFLQETQDTLLDNGKSEKDVLWVGCSDAYISWEQFVSIANFNYDHGFGAQKIAKDLLIVGNGWWLERHEYDGSEWWEYKECPQRPEQNVFDIKVVGGDQFMWPSLTDINY